MQARRQVLAIMNSNREAPLQLCALFDQYMSRLAMDTDAYVTQLMSKTPLPSLEEFASIIDDLKNEAQAVRDMCANTVRTGIYSCVPTSRCALDCSQTPHCQRSLQLPPTFCSLALLFRLWAWLHLPIGLATDGVHSTNCLQCAQSYLYGVGV